MSYPRPSLAADLALITVADGDLKCLLMRRDDALTVGGDWALPGGYVRIDETIEAAALRVLRDKVGLDPVYLEQLYTYGAVNRDPRERVISVTHLALVPAETLAGVVDQSDGLQLATVSTDWSGSGRFLQGQGAEGGTQGCLKEPD